MGRDYLKFEDNIAACVVSVLANGGLSVPTASIQYSASSVTATTPRVAVRVSDVARVDDHMAFAVGAWQHDHYSAAIDVEVVTRRTAGQDHDGDVAKVRQRFDIAGQYFAAASTFYQFLDFDERGSARAVDDQQREDSTVIAFACRFAIESNAIGNFDVRTTSDGGTRTTPDGDTRMTASL